MASFYQPQWSSKWGMSTYTLWSMQCFVFFAGLALNPPAPPPVPSFLFPDCEVWLDSGAIILSPRVLGKHRSFVVYHVPHFYLVHSFVAGNVMSSESVMMTMTSIILKKRWLNVHQFMWCPFYCFQFSVSWMMWIRSLHLNWDLRSSTA